MQRKHQLSCLTKKKHIHHIDRQLTHCIKFKIAIIY